MRLHTALFAALLLWQGAAFADIVESKSGQKLEGTILEEKDGGVTLEVDGLELKLTKDEIQSIQRAPVAKKKTVPAKVLAARVESAADAPAQGAPAPQGPDLSQLERPVIVFDQRDWKLGFQDMKNNQVIAEFVVNGQTVQNWTELVTAQLFIGLRSEPRYFVQYVKEKTAAVCPNTKWQTIRETPYDITYEWSVRGCGEIPDQSEIARVVLGLDGLHVLHYASKVGELSAEDRAKWIGCLEASQFVKPQAKTQG